MSKLSDELEKYLRPINSEMCVNELHPLFVKKNAQSMKTIANNLSNLTN